VQPAILDSHPALANRGSRNPDVVAREQVSDAYGTLQQ
jgi:hypothetical protein